MLNDIRSLDLDVAAITEKEISGKDHSPQYLTMTRCDLMGSGDGIPVLSRKEFGLEMQMIILDPVVDLVL